jgi:hypothetical protein
MQKLLVLVFVLGLSFIACRKGALPEEYYFGKVNVSQTPLVGSPSLDIYFENEKIGTVAATGTISTFTMPANKSGKLSIYKASTDSLVADTAIIVPQNASINLKLIYSDLLGIKGFLNSDSNVGADSVKLQFTYNFPSSFYNYPEIDLYVVDITRTDTAAVLKGLKPGILNPQTLTLLHTVDGNGIFYYCMLKDVATGEFIKMKYKNRNYFGFLTGETYYDGHLNIVQITDNGGDETSNKILVNVTTL